MDEDQAIIRSALELLRERGIAGMSLDDVALRARVHPAAVFTQWRSRSDLVVELLRRHADASQVVPDSGDLRDDLEAEIRRCLETLEAIKALPATVIDQATRDPELASELHLFVVSWQTAVSAQIDRAIHRGDLPRGFDRDGTIELVAALIWFRILLVGEPALAELPGRLANMILGAPVATDGQ